MVSWITVPPTPKPHILLKILSWYTELTSNREQFRSTIHAFKHYSVIRLYTFLFKVAPLSFEKEINYGLQMNMYWRLLYLATTFSESSSICGANRVRGKFKVPLWILTSDNNEEGWQNICCCSRLSWWRGSWGNLTTGFSYDHVVSVFRQKNEQSCRPTNHSYLCGVVCGACLLIFFFFLIWTI